MKITWYKVYNYGIKRKCSKKSDDNDGGFQQQSPQRLIDEYKHMNNRQNRMHLRLKPLKVV